MTTEEKARAYDEALEVMRQWIAPCHTKEQLDTLKKSVFPELAESEDERIRRWLCDYFSSIDKAWIHKDITCIDILRWLEKQKEQKPAEWSDDDSDNLERVENYLWMLDDYVGDDCAMPQGKTDKIRENIQEILLPWLKSLPKRFNLQPKQEWSDEEYGRLFDIEHYLGGTLQLSPDRRIACINFLKSLYNF